MDLGTPVPRLGSLRTDVLLSLNPWAAPAMGVWPPGPGGHPGSGRPVSPSSLWPQKGCTALRAGGGSRLPTAFQPLLSLSPPGPPRPVSRVLRAHPVSQLPRCSQNRLTPGSHLSHPSGGIDLELAFSKLPRHPCARAGWGDIPQAPARTSCSPSLRTSCSGRPLLAAQQTPTHPPKPMRTAASSEASGSARRAHFIFTLPAQHLANSPPNAPTGRAADSAWSECIVWVRVCVCQCVY